jgi:hypothetical protein
MVSKTLKRRQVESSGIFATLHPVLQRVYGARGIKDPKELDYALNRLPSPRLFKNMDKAVALLAEALEAHRQILVVADFDADGATSCAVAVRALRLLGAEVVDYLVPNRFTHGYGLTLDAANGERLKTFLIRLRARMVLQSLHFEFSRQPPVPGLLGDAELSQDRYGYTWVLSRHTPEDVAGLVNDLHAVNTFLQDGGFGPQLLCSLVTFADERDRALAVVYLYKRGTFYPFAPLPGGGEKRDNALELQTKALLGDDLRVEGDLARWFPVWGAPGLG